MSGKLTVGSVLGHGSTFTVDIPMAESSAELVATEGMEALADPVTVEVASAFSVLSIEDNASNFRLIEAILAERPNIKLIGATRGEEGLALARSHCPDLILLDLHLPDIMGWDVLRRLRDFPETRSTAVVVISADATEKQIERLLTPPEGHRGATAYLTKPLNVKEVLHVIDSIFQALITTRAIESPIPTERT